MQIIHFNIRVKLLTNILTGLFYCTFLSAQNNKQIESLKLLIDSYQYNEAIKLANNYLVADSTNSEILYYKGKAQSANYMYRNAIVSYIKAYYYDSLNIDLMEDITKTYQLLGDNENAIYYCVKIIKLKPENYFFKVQLANIYYANLNYNESINTIIPLFKKDTTNVYLLKLIGNNYTELRKFDSAILYYNKAYKLLPTDLFINQKLTNLYIKTKEYDKGLVITNVYLKRDSLQLDILVQNAYCLYLLKDYPLSMSQFMRSLELGENTKFLFKYLGLSFYKMEEYGLAEKYLTIAFKKDTTDAELGFYLGVSAYKSMHADTGIFYFNKTMDLIMPSNQFLTTLYLEQAEAYNHLYKFDTALILLKKAYEVDSLNSTVVFRMAYQYDSWILDNKLAKKYFEKYLKLANEPDNKEGDALNSISTIPFVNGRLETLSKIKDKN